MSDAKNALVDNTEGGVNKVKVSMADPVAKALNTDPGTS